MVGCKGQMAAKQQKGGRQPGVEVTKTTQTWGGYLGIFEFGRHRTIEGMATDS